MKLGKKILALALAVCLTVGLMSAGSVSHAEGTTGVLNETLLLKDLFDSGTTWSSDWRLSDEKFAGIRNETAPLGYNSSARNFYNGTGYRTLSDVHLKAKVCVKSEETSGGWTQYHLLVARADATKATGEGGIAFGFKTVDKNSYSTLVLGIYGGNDTFTSFYESTNTYSLGDANVHSLELIVVGNLIVAKCDQTTVYAEEKEGISASGLCGIVDRRATSDSSGTNYTKGGYFDDFYLYNDVKLDQYAVSGMATIDENGIGTTDVTLLSNNVEVATLSDVEISIPELANKSVGIHEGSYNAVATIMGKEQTLSVSQVLVTAEGVELVAYEDFEADSFEDAAKWQYDDVTFSDGTLVFPYKTSASSYTTSAYFNTTFSDGYTEATIKITSADIASGKTLYPVTLFCRKASTGGGVIRARFQISGSTGAYSAAIQTLVMSSRNSTATPNSSTAYYATSTHKIEDFAIGKEYVLRVACVGNFVYTMLDGEVVAENVIPNDIGVNNTEGYFGVQTDYHSTNGGVALAVDSLTIMKHSPYAVAKAAEDTSINLDTYNMVKVSGGTTTSGQRTAFLPGEEVTVTTTPTDGYQLAAVGGLTYTFDGVTDSSTFIIDDRTGDAGDNQGTCNEFVFKMPSSNITIAADYVSETAAEAPNMGIRKVNLREKTDSMKRGIRFNSRAYKEFTVNGEVYKLTDASTIGTLVFKQGTTVDEEILKSCLNNNGYVVEGATLGMKVQSTKLQDLCDEYVDWGLVLSYNEDSALFDSEYIVYSYAVYDVNGTMTPVFSDAKAYSYNEVATALGYEAIVNE